jgi:chromosome segregation ATPase
VIDSDTLRKMAKRKRSRANLDDVRDNVLGELEEIREKTSTYTSAVETLTDNLDEMVDALDDLRDHAVIDDAEHAKRQAAIETFRGMLSISEEETPDLDGAVEALTEVVDEYESSLDDRDLAAEDREQIWGELQDKLIDVADALDSVSGKGGSA